MTDIQSAEKVDENKKAAAPKDCRKSLLVK
jgi:hypothetical protein